MECCFVYLTKKKNNLSSERIMAVVLPTTLEFMLMGQLCRKKIVIQRANIFPFNFRFCRFTQRVGNTVVDMRGIRYLNVVECKNLFATLDFRVKSISVILDVLKLPFSFG